MSLNVQDLRIGNRVIALYLLDADAANIQPGTLGTVRDPAGHAGPEYGPLIHWDTDRFCNVYNGQVMLFNTAIEILRQFDIGTLR